MTRNKGKIIIFSMLLFLLVFNPPIVKGLSFTQIAVVFMGMICVVNIKWTIYILRCYTVKKFIVYITLFIIYCIIEGIVNGLLFNITAFENSFQSVFYLMCSIIVAFGVSIIFLKYHVTFDKILDLYIYVGLIQAFFSISCLLSPEIKNILNNLTMKNSDDPAFAKVFIANSFRRNYGFASTLFDIFGCTMSIIAILALTQAIKQKKPQYLLSFVLISISGIMNARTSIILIGLGTFIVLLLPSCKKVKVNNFLFILFTIIMGIIIATGATGYLLSSNTESAEWLKTGLFEIISMIRGDKIGYFNTLLNDFIFVPDNPFQLLFGTGLLPNQAIGRGSDVGYIQNIWQYGMMGSLILYFAYFELIKNAIIFTKRKYSNMGLAVFAIIAIYMIKLNCLGYSMASTVFFPIVLISNVMEVRKGGNSNQRNISSEQQLS